MGYICDFCGSQRSMVYCQSDAACLCLSCDRHVHSANALSKRHSRTLLCERCNSQPAFVRCVEEGTSLCQNCDWMGHSASTSTSTHNRQNVNYYSGCPSAAEFSTIWTFVLDIPSVDDSTCEHGLGSININKDSAENCSTPADINSSQDISVTAEVNDLQLVDKSRVWVGSASLSQSNSAPEGVDQVAVSSTSTQPKLLSPGTSGLGHGEDDDLCGDLNMDEVDLDFENYEELFGVALSHSEQLFENGGISSLFGTKSMSGADSNCQGAVMAEGPSVGSMNTMKLACNNAVSADSMMSSKTDPLHCFTEKQNLSTLSFSGLTGESSPRDYQDCGASPMLLMGEPPWCPPCPETSFTSSRSSAVMRYKEKKKART